MLKKKKIYLYYINIFFQISAKFSNSSLFTWEVTRLIQVSSMIFHINIINVYCCYEYFLLVSTVISWDNRIYFNDLGNYRRDGDFFLLLHLVFLGVGEGVKQWGYILTHAHTLGEPVKITWSWFFWGIVKLRTSASWGMVVSKTCLTLGIQVFSWCSHMAKLGIFSWFGWSDN